MDASISTLFEQQHLHGTESDQIWLAALSLATLKSQSIRIFPSMSHTDSSKSPSPAKDIPVFTPWSRSSRSDSNAAFQKSLRTCVYSYIHPQTYSSSPDSPLHRYVLTLNHRERQRRQYQLSQSARTSHPKINDACFLDAEDEDDDSELEENIEKDWVLVDTQQRAKETGHGNNWIDRWKGAQWFTLRL